jgi:p-hydroxybenzoate 3-monooxygenase
MADRTQVGIIGAGPAGLLLSHLLHLQGITSTVLESRDREYVERRVRAGVLEHGSVQTLREAGVSERLDREGLEHGGTELRFNGQGHRIDFRELVGRAITVYGQQEVVKDLIAQRIKDIGDLRFNIDGIELHRIDTDRPAVSFLEGGEARRFDCDFIIGADGFHGISRAYIPDQTVWDRHYHFAWLGILAEAAPSSHELIYARHQRGFALHSMRTPAITRQYLQVRPNEDLADWPDHRIWDELRTRLSTDEGFVLNEGPLIDKSITPMRSYVTSPMQYGRLFLAGDSAHIVPPTGAKGMNLAIADVRLLSRALGGYYATGRTDLLDEYTQTALVRVWRATHFSWFMTTMLHTDAHSDPFEDQLALSQLEYVCSSRAMGSALAENYTGLPYPHGWSYRD